MTVDATAMPSGIRNAALPDLAALLRDQQARKADIVARHGSAGSGCQCAATESPQRCAGVARDGPAPGSGPGGVVVRVGGVDGADGLEGVLDEAAPG
jgi:hypothetical protein